MLTTTTTTTTAPTRLAASPRIADTLDSYESAMAGQRKLRPRAVGTYARVIARFGAWLGPESTIADLTPDAIGRWQMARAQLATATISKELSAIRSYCRWAMRAGLLHADPTAEMEYPKKRRRLPRPLKQEQLRQLEAILSRQPSALDVRARRVWLRNRRIVLLQLYTGVRRAEIAGLTWDDVYLSEAQIIVKTATAKGGHERIVPLHPRVVAELETTPEANRRGAVAGHPDGRCLSHKSIGHIFERWLADQGLRISSHKLRHSCATEMLRSGASLREVQETLGHADVRTTEGYAALIPERQRAAIERLPDRFGE